MKALQSGFQMHLAKPIDPAELVVAVAALAMYLLDYLGRVWDPAAYLSTLSPFHYFEPMTLVSGTPLRVRDVAVLLAIGGAGAAASYAIFSRRDL